MTLDEALLYYAEWWLSKPGEMDIIDNEDLPKVMVNWGYTFPNTYDQLSWLCLFIREAIRDV